MKKYSDSCRIKKNFPATTCTAALLLALSFGLSSCGNTGGSDEETRINSAETAPAGTSVYSETTIASSSVPVTSAPPETTEEASVTPSADFENSYTKRFIDMILKKDLRADIIGEGKTSRFIINGDNFFYGMKSDRTTDLDREFLQEWYAIDGRYTCLIWNPEYSHWNEGKLSAAGADGDMSDNDLLDIFCLYSYDTAVEKGEFRADTDDEGRPREWLGRMWYIYDAETGYLVETGLSNETALNHYYTVTMPGGEIVFAGVYPETAPDLTENAKALPIFPWARY